MAKRAKERVTTQRTETEFRELREPVNGNGRDRRAGGVSGFIIIAILIGIAILIFVLVPSIFSGITDGITGFFGDLCSFGGFFGVIGAVSLGSAGVVKAVLLA